MREEDAIKNCVSKCCRSLTNDKYSTYEIQKWIHRRKMQQQPPSTNESNSEGRRRRIHRGFVVERRENPISGLRAYWRPIKSSEAGPVGRSNSNRNKAVPVVWRKSDSQLSSEASSDCTVFQCYQRPAQRKAGGKEAVVKSSVRPKAKESKIRPRKKIQDSATQTVDANASNQLDEDDEDVKEYMRDERGPTAEEKSREGEREKEKEVEKIKRRIMKKHYSALRGPRFARGFSVPNAGTAARPEEGEAKKCSTCGHRRVSKSESSSEDESSVTEDDSRLDQVVLDAKWAIQRRAAIQNLFLTNNQDYLGRW